MKKYTTKNDTELKAVLDALKQAYHYGATIEVTIKVLTKEENLFALDLS